jgi:YVTN family beta-propeller protein
MSFTSWKRALVALAIALAGTGTAPALAGQVPYGTGTPDTPISARDRFYLSDQTSDTVSVVNPATNQLLGVIRLGQPDAGSIGPLYTGQLLVHGMGFSPDHRTLVVVSIGSNSLAFIDTATNRVKHITYIGRAPHEAFFTQDGKQVWATVRGENYLSVVDANTYHEVRRIQVPYGPGMTIFSPDNRYAYECSSFTPQTVVIDRATYQIIGRVKQPSPFCPNIAVTPDETQVWETLKDIGHTLVFNAKPPFNIIANINTGPITNHVNIVRNSHGQFAYVTIGGLNEVKVFTTDATPKLVATIPTGELPHGIWPSGDGSRVYVGLENSDAAAVIDTLTNRVIATIHTGQSPQGVAYVPDAVPSGDGMQNLVALGASGSAAHLVLADATSRAAKTTVTVNNQGVLDLLEAAVTGLAPGSTYTLGLASNPDGSGKRVFLASFKTNPAGAQIVTAIAPLRAMVSPNANMNQRRYVVIVKGGDMQGGTIAQVEQTPVVSAMSPMSGHR